MKNKSKITIDEGFDWYFLLKKKFILCRHQCVSFQISTHAQKKILEKRHPVDLLVLSTK